MDSASRPFLFSSTDAAFASREPTPTFSTSAAATPSGNGKSDWTTSARRSGTLYVTPRIPPMAHTANDSQYGNPVHQPTITRPGSTKMMADSVPAADAIVWTMLFSQIVAFLNNARRTAIEITAAGIDEAKVRPTFNPRYTLAAVNTSVMAAPRTMPRQVSSKRVSRTNCAVTEAKGQTLRVRTVSGGRAS